MDTLFEMFDAQVFAYLGAALAFGLAGMGSSKGVGVAGQAGAGVLTEDPNKFGQVMLLQALPSTQAIYGFVIAFMIFGAATPELSLAEGLYLFAAGLPIGLVGLMSGIFQGKVSAAGISMIAKRPEGLGRAIILALMVEMFAIIGLIVSLLMII